MTNFVGGDNDTRKSTRVFNDSHTVDLLQALVNDTSSSDVGKS